MVVGKFCVYTAGPNTALVKSTGKIVIAGRMFALPIVQRVDSLDLGLRTITVHTTHGITINGVPVEVTGCCQVKIHGWYTVAGRTREKMSVDHDAIRLAAQHFIGKSEAEIDEAIQKTVEGHQRAIVGRLTVQQLYKDRTAFSNRVKEMCVDDMRNMGLLMVSYTVADISDEHGYIDKLGVQQFEKVKRRAAERQEESRSLAQSKQAEYEAAAHMKVNSELQKTNESDKVLRTKQADAQREIDRAVAVQKQAAKIEEAEQDAILLVEQQKATAAMNEAEREVIELRIEKQRYVREMDVNIAADAILYKNKAEADARRIQSMADADRIRALSIAEAEAIRAKGQADMDILEERVQMWNQCGNSDAMLERIIDVLPDIAAQLVAPLEQTEKLVFVDSGADDEAT